VERHVDNLGVLKWHFFQNSSPTASGIIIVSRVTGCWDSVQYPISPVLNTHMIREYDDRKDEVSSMNGTDRVNIKPGLQVSIILKKDQRSGKLTEGIVKDILTKSPAHPHGIKVRLESGQVGRVKEIII